MKSHLRPMLVPAACLALAACASDGNRTSQAPVQATPVTATAAAITQPDGVYMAQVEKAARRAGVEVVWVNVPRKRAATD